MIRCDQATYVVGDVVPGQTAAQPLGRHVEPAAENTDKVWREKLSIDVIRFGSIEPSFEVVLAALVELEVRLDGRVARRACILRVQTEGVVITSSNRATCSTRVPCAARSCRLSRASCNAAICLFRTCIRNPYYDIRNNAPSAEAEVEQNDGVLERAEPDREVARLQVAVDVADSAIRFDLIDSIDGIDRSRTRAAARRPRVSGRRGARP